MLGWCGCVGSAEQPHDGPVLHARPLLGLVEGFPEASPVESITKHVCVMCHFCSVQSMLVIMASCVCGSGSVAQQVPTAHPKQAFQTYLSCRPMIINTVTLVHILSL